MTSQARATLKSYFNTNDQPTEAQFADLIDSAVSVSEETALFPLLAGRAGGQTLYGGTAANDDLTLAGTSHGTKITSYVALDSNIKLMQVEKPTTAPSVAVKVEAGNLTGAYYYSVSYVTPSGETESSINSALVSPSAQKVDLTNIPVSPSSQVTGRNIYRNTAAGSNRKMLLVALINDNTTTVYTDNVADGSLTTKQPFVNTTGGQLFNNSDRCMVADRVTTALGVSALGVNFGYANTAVGFLALAFNDTGGYNVAVGVNALRDNLSDHNTAVGVDALVYNSSGTRNTAIGEGSLGYNVAGGDNVAVGYFALQQNLGNSNVAIGSYALPVLASTATANVAIGYRAGRFQASGNSNVAIGYDAMYYNPSGESNVCIGYNAGKGATTKAFAQNTLIGAAAGLALETGAQNVLIGYNAGATLTTGHRNIIIGYNVAVSAVGVTEELNIGGAILGAVGATKKIAFLGAAASARLSHVENPAAGATVDAEARSAINSILTTLETFGFHATA